MIFFTPKMKQLNPIGIWALLGYVLSHETTTPFSIGSPSAQVQYGEQQREDCTSLKKFRCRICGVTFDGRRPLTSHITKIHPGEQPYWCELCDKSFSVTTSLRNHMLTHTGEKPFSCDICNKRFNVKGNLQHHKKLHEVGGRYFSCATCGASFRSQSSFTKHMKFHETPFSCNLCYRKFKKVSELQAHTRTHENEKFYPCELCRRIFKFEYSLARHVKSHLNYGKTCRLSDDLEMPMRMHLETANAEGLPLQSENDERFKMRFPPQHPQAHAGHEIEQEDDNSGHSQVLDHIRWTSAIPDIACSCYRGTEMVPENHPCIFEHLFDQRAGATESNDDRGNESRLNRSLESHPRGDNSSGQRLRPQSALSNGTKTRLLVLYKLFSEVPDEPTWMQLDSIQGASSFEYQAGIIRDNNCVVEDFVGINPGPQTTIREILAQPEASHRSSRIALEMSGSPGCDIRGNTNSDEVQSVISEILRSYCESYSSDTRSYQSGI